ncbi:uncharacterized protein BJ212DRAFT_1477883 [Suillus subaureus]|uniref:Crinkler effector protein N-terminal domain-containing protein n=1 Tax=Suillus subaureus TaxID=48587 RepID=A0A9P7JH66_9AGAM|nr:uncharacterized protein BJ212DRAFT_1490980 [Suillus subaureus]XP_041196795.1 uncharacterized protein BJ212DRAFT_1477883 [Suillus subaureus]KAG1791477.1 hypothetical protein BJ212DRAFT_1490980 [Suillus subaureus]KAG1822055.1 hypothetical protein BJ212DRAFT_1477883 [Suillus subaureus]
MFWAMIAQTQTIGDLREAIKDKKKQQFDHVYADHLELWQVKINLNDLHLLNTIVDESMELKLLMELSKVFMDGVEHGCIHVMV